MIEGFGPASAPPSAPAGAAAATPSAGSFLQLLAGGFAAPAPLAGMPESLIEESPTPPPLTEADPAGFLSAWFGLAPLPSAANDAGLTDAVKNASVLPPAGDTPSRPPPLSGSLSLNSSVETVNTLLTEGGPDGVRINGFGLPPSTAPSLPVAVPLRSPVEVQPAIMEIAPKKEGQALVPMVEGHAGSAAVPHLELDISLMMERELEAHFEKNGFSQVADASMRIGIRTESVARSSNDIVSAHLLPNSPEDLTVEAKFTESIDPTISESNQSSVLSALAEDLLTANSAPKTGLLSSLDTTSTQESFGLLTPDPGMGTAGRSVERLAPAPAQQILNVDIDFDAALDAQLRWQVDAGLSEAVIDLNPAELGALTIRIQMHGDQTSLHIHAAEAATRQLLQQLLPQMGERLAQSGLSYSGGEVRDRTRQDGEGAASLSSRDTKSSTSRRLVPVYLVDTYV